MDFQIGTLADPGQDYEVRYSYNHANRVAAQGYWFEYDYLPTSLENSAGDRGTGSATRQVSR